MGSGKTTVGRRVAELAGSSFVDLDELIEKTQGRPVAEIFSRQGEAAFREIERRMVQVAAAPGTVVALGGGAPMQDEIWRWLAARAVTVFLDAPLDVLRARIGEGAGRPLAGGDLEALLNARLARYREADHAVDATRPVEEVAKEAASLWNA